jgi:hypothetical protein
MALQYLTFLLGWFGLKDIEDNKKALLQYLTFLLGWFRQDLLDILARHLRVAIPDFSLSLVQTAKVASWGVDLQYLTFLLGWFRMKKIHYIFS